jgi:bifunctional non-homologous end joining protein LigD
VRRTDKCHSEQSRGIFSPELSRSLHAGRDDKLNTMLYEYQRKRKFDKTPEPAPHRFVIQKHAASHLHYDLRLEVNGVLKSWAVPKGPSLDPQIKRLAMMTEDHPLDYRTFEGTIPKGNYGAGEVIVWDRGTYELAHAASEKKVDLQIEEKIEKGHLSIILHGEKLQGEFTLARSRPLPLGKGQGEGNTWFLIKKGDEFASDENITRRNNSVLSERELGDKRGEKIITNISGIIGAEKAIMPHDIKPMLAMSTDTPFDNREWIYEIKWDGYRAIAEIDDKKIKLYSRNGQDFTVKFDPVNEELKKINRACILDGEIVVLDEEGRSSFQMLQYYLDKKKGHLAYIVFDILYLDGYDLKDVPLIKRKELLREIIPSTNRIHYSDYIEERGKDFFTLVKQQSIEGIIAKEKNSSYVEGIRSKQWLKIKTKYQQEAIICGYTEPRKSRKYFGALILGVYKDGELTYIGHTGTGFDDETLKKLKTLLDRYKSGISPFKKVPIPNAPVQWLVPKNICEVSFTEWTEEGVMRHPVFLGMREDKIPEEVTNEKVSKVSASNAAAARVSEALEKKFNSKLKITNPSKIYFPKDSLTKADIIAYYDSMAEIMLPYLKDRPQSLNRFPNGIEEKSFYQKNLEEHPSWIKTIPLYSASEDKTIHYVLCQDKQTLLYLANLGCIEINVWNSRIQHLDNPDYLVIDLDPQGVPFDKVIEAALLVRDVLEKSEIPSFPKTSGATGMHIYIPLAAKYSTEIVRKFAEIVAHIVHDRAPDWTSIVRNPSKRQGRLYLDFLQNREGQTMAAPYSIRPRRKAPVSTPLYWDEVTAQLTPETFTIKNILKRIEEVGDPWKDIFNQSTDIEKSLRSLQAKGLGDRG